MKKLVSLLLAACLLLLFAVGAAETANEKNPNSGGVNLNPYDADGDPSNGIKSGDLPEVIQKRMQNKGVELPVLRLLPLGFAVTVTYYDETNGVVIDEIVHGVWRGGEITVTAPTLSGYTLVPDQETSVTFKDVLEDKAVTFNYTQDGPVLYTLTVQYDTFIRPTDVYQIGADEFPFTVWAQPVAGYVASGGDVSHTFEFNGADQRYIFDYYAVGTSAPSWFTVYYVDQATGKSIASPLFYADGSGIGWTVFAIPIPGYTAQAPTTYTFLSHTHDEAYTFYYTKDD